MPSSPLRALGHDQPRAAAGWMGGPAERPARPATSAKTSPATGPALRPLDNPPAHAPNSPKASAPASALRRAGPLQAAVHLLAGQGAHHHRPGQGEGDGEGLVRVDAA